MAKDRPTTLIEKIDTGRALVVDSDPDGNRVVHEKRATRRYELMHEIGVISDDHRIACDLLRDNYTWARLVADQRAGGHTASTPGDKHAAAWTRHQRCMAFLGPAKALVVQAVILHDEPPINVGARVPKPLSRLENALDDLAVYCAKGYLDTLT